MCEVTDRCMAPSRFRVRVRYGKHPAVILVTDTCRRHLSIAVSQGLDKGAVTVQRAEHG